MCMDKRFLLVGLLLVFFMASAFAVTHNSIEHFNLAWNPSTNQLNIGVQCEGQAMGTLVLSNGQSRDIICGTMDFGQTWLLGDEWRAGQLSGVFTIPEPCDVCSMSSEININSPENQSDLFILQLMFAVIMVVFILVMLFIVSKLQR